MNTTRKKLTFLFLVIPLFALGVFINSYREELGFRSSEVSFSSLSPLGSEGGASLPASCESGYEHFPNECAVNPPMCGCSSTPNSCGMTNPGLLICGNPAACPAPAPSDSACVPPTISIGTPGNVGSPTGGTPTGGIPTGTTPTTGPTKPTDKPIFDQTVPRGGSCTIAWNATPATSCKITGPGVSKTVGASGTFTTPRIGVDTAGSARYTITCFNGTTIATYANFMCRLPAVIKETN